MLNWLCLKSTTLSVNSVRRDFGKVTYVNENIELSGIGNGLYVVSIKVGNERYEQKLVISKD